MNLLCTALLLILLGIIADNIDRSLDCIGGNKKACELVAKRYEATP